MPVNKAVADKVWNRFTYARENGHDLFVKKADLCEAFVRGKQWKPEDEAALALVKRPAMTINKILPTVRTALAEQIYNRAEISYQPRSGASEQVATALAKMFKQISDNNHLDWRRSDMFADGYITGRGFLDVRMDYTDSMFGEVRVSNLPPKNVVLDPDADEYDPDTWGDVMTSKWYTPDDIAVLYNKADADILRERGPTYAQYGVDAIDFNRDRFGSQREPTQTDSRDAHSVLRSVRVIDRQYRMLDRQKHFVDRVTGDLRPVPESFDRDRIAFVAQESGYSVIDKLVRRVRWTVIADDIVLHDEWSPYKHFTIVPFFPMFRHGHTTGDVENLIGPQEVLNKVTSQELHVVNTTANSGYKVKAGSLANMTPEELEAKGAQTGIVIEVNGDPDKDVVKIQPNNVPQGLDRISFKAEASIKSISGVNDSMQGFDREDVAAKAIEQKKQSGSAGMAKTLDSLTRTDTLLARNILDLIQGFYTEERIVTIVKDTGTGEVENLTVNEITPEGQIVNDLTLGEYSVVVTSVPHRETMEDSEFEQLLSLRQLGIAIPDTDLIQSSRVRNKMELIRRMTGDKDSPEAQAQAQLEQRAREAEVAKVENEAKQKDADALLKTTKAQKEAATPIEGPEQISQAEEAATVAEMDRDERKMQHEMQLDMFKLQIDRQKTEDELALKQQDLAQKREDAAAQQAQQAAAAALKPQKPSN